MKKASIVVTCYNKEKYIAGMFDSILAQKWKNIEVVLVNDGSTDKTREIITEYETKFKKKGYSVIIIDQKNSGVITAAKNGLLACTGDYFCIVDADDKLCPEYVSLPVSILEKHKKFDYTMCSFDEVDFNAPKQEPKRYKITIKDSEKNMLSCYLLSKIPNMPWLYMVRSSYLKKEFFKKSYSTSSKGTHEPGFNIPLMALGGNVKIVDKPLYLWNKTIDLNRHSYFSKYKDQESHLVKYHKLIKLALNSLPNKIASKKQKEQFVLQAEFKKLKILFWHSTGDNFILDGDLHKKETLKKLLRFINKHFQIKINAKILSGKVHYFTYLIDEILFTDKKLNKKTDIKRIICYGAMGKVAEQWLPFILPLIKEKFKVELWDKNGDGKKIQPADFKTLKNNDVVFVFPRKKEVVKEIKRELKKANFKNAVFNLNEMAMYAGK
ncbi:MAG: glycosyltransferase family 2 protein [Fibromonadales bacterium]|nr:glycosyltransferase family 2 protein [Fibromonadales bacterium]